MPDRAGGVGRRRPDGGVLCAAFTARVTALTFFLPCYTEKVVSRLD